MEPNLLPVSELPALLVLERDHDSLADLSFEDLDVLILALCGATSCAVVSTDFLI